MTGLFAKAALGDTLGANPDFYDRFADNAKTWYKRIQENCLYLNHAIVNPPINRNKPSDTVKDIYVHVTRETEEGIYVNGAKVVATNSALTHYNFIGQTAAQEIGDDPDFALLFITPMNAKGVKLISRVSYEKNATDSASPFDYPLSSRFDENDAILILENVFIPWEDVLIYKDKQKLMWDAVGTEFGGRHHLYELNYAGTADAIRIQCLGSARATGEMAKMRALSQKCMSEYDVDGWKIPGLK